MITWLSTKDEIGSASLYASNITLNTVAMNKFLTAYRVMVGIDDDNNIILAPLDKDRVLRGDLKEQREEQQAAKCCNKVNSKAESYICLSREKCKMLF